MKKTNKNKVKEFIRVDHAGERGAIKIYEGQLLALNTFIKDDNLKTSLSILSQWDFVVDKKSQTPTIFNEFFQKLMENIYIRRNNRTL